MDKERLIVIGDNCFDITLKGKFTFDQDKNFIPQYFKKTPAGTGVNFALSFAEYYGDASYFTPISTDAFGETIREVLKSKGINILSRPSQKDTALIIAVVDDKGDRTTFALLRNSSYEDLGSKEFQKVAKDFTALYISGGVLTSAKARKEVMKIVLFAKNSGMKIFFDPQIRIGYKIGGFLETALDIAYLSDIVLANREELKVMDLPQDIFIVDKKGKDGATVFYRSKQFSVKGIKVDVKDTTGAGDVFNGAFLSKYLQGAFIPEALKFANYAAAISVTKDGVYIPTVNEIMELAGDKL